MLDRVLQERNREQAWRFLLDQSLHVLAILIVWESWRRWLGPITPGPLAPENLGLLTALALLAGAYVLNAHGAALWIGLFLARFAVSDRSTSSPTGPAEICLDLRGMGRTIGILERMLTLSLVILGQWEAVGWIFAGKTVARFRELDDRAFSEYYLIGTLSSLLFAATTGSAVRLALFGSL